MQDNTSTIRGWQEYWRGARDADSYSPGGVSHPTVDAFWAATLADCLSRRTNARILDIATGDGAVLGFLSAVDHDCLRNVTCVDASAAAIDRIMTRYPVVHGVVADAGSMPLQDGSFDLVTSQFGIEYAGSSAIDEAVRVLADGGSLLCLVHMTSSLFYDECAAALAAIEATQKSGFVPLALDMFSAGFAAVRGADRGPYEAAAARLDPAVRIVEGVLAEYGEHVAGGTVAALYTGVARIHHRLPNYYPDEVSGWLRSMQQELPGYADRMRSMCEAAMDEDAFLRVRDRLQGWGLAPRQDDRLVTGSGEPLAWILQATMSG